MIPGVSSLLLIDQFKIDLPIVAAFLTLIGFSVNDTIVIFDRIREIKGKTPHLTEQDGQRRHQPDPEPDDPDVAHRLARRRRSSTSSAARACTASPSPWSSAS